MPKSIRSLAHFAQKWGGTPSPAVPGARLPDGTEAVPGLAGVDGSLFVRVAGLISENQGWVRAGANEDDWDRSALGWDGAWAMDKVTGRWGGGTDA